MDSKIGTHGGDLKHIYTQDGEIKESNGNLNKETTTSGVKTGGDKLVKMESGTWSTSTQSKGSDTANAITPVVLSNGQIVPTTKSSGSTVKPVYVDGGAIKPITGSKGNDTRPVYLDNGEIKETTFPQADVVGVDAQHKVIKTTVGDGLKVESNTLKVNYGNGIKLDTSDPKKIIADVTVSPSYTTGTQVASVKVGTTESIIKVPTATSSQLGLVKNGSNINNSSGTLSVPHAGDNLSNPGVLKTPKNSTVVGTDGSGNLKAAAVTTGTSDDTTIASKGYVDDNTPAAGKLIVVDSSATGGRKIHVDVEDALKNSGSDTVKDADMIGIKSDKIAKVTVSNGLEKDSSNNLKVKAHTDITVTANGVAANNMRPLAGTNTTVGGTDNRQVNVATANGANLGVVKQGTNVTIKSDGSVNVPTAGGATDPAGVIRSVKNADFVGTDANGQLVSRTVPAQSPLEGTLTSIGSDGRTVNVRTDFPAGYAGPIGVAADGSNLKLVKVEEGEGVTYHTVRFYNHKRAKTNGQEPIYTASVPHNSLLDAPQVGLRGWTFQKWNNYQENGPDFCNPIVEDTDYYASWTAVVEIDEIQTDIGHVDGTSEGNVVSYGFLPIDGISILTGSEVSAIVSSCRFSHNTFNRSYDGYHRFIISMAFPQVASNDVAISTNHGCIQFGSEWKTTMTSTVFVSHGNSKFNQTNYDNSKNPYFIVGGVLADKKSDTYTVGNPDDFNPPNQVIPLAVLQHHVKNDNEKHYKIQETSAAKSCTITRREVYPVIVVHKCLNNVDFSGTDDDAFSENCNLILTVRNIRVRMMC